MSKKEEENEMLLLMKSGFVVRESPRPSMGSVEVPDGGNMSWDEIRKMTEKMEGR